MRLGRTSTICFLSISAAYAAAFAACGGETGGDSSGTRTTSTTNTTNTTNATTSTTIVITGAGGAGGGTTTGGTGGNGGGVVIDGDAACVAEPRAGEQIPLDLFFMVDKSGSMGCPVGQPGMNCTTPPNPPPAVNRWTSIKEALVSFANSPASNGLGAGMGFFPQYSNPNGTGMLRCNPQDYSTPAAPIAALPGAAPALQAALDAQTSNGNTPTVPALSGAIQYSTSYAQTHPGRTVGVVFATDGAPTECTQNDNTVPGAVRVAQAAAMGTPPIRTYVLGVGPNLANLNQIAVAGGTQKAYLVEGGGSTELITALNEIRKSALTCDYQIPIIPGKPLDLDLVNIKVRVGPPPSSEQQIYRVDGAAQCGPQGGWYFDNPSAPTRIQLCPTTCDPLLKTTGSGLTVLIGCRVVVKPPN
ncbi:MAG TPA: vWA domain-containing protein [Polyangiaceae bacterium]|nr:vWA domain-containing protein [Polyangiaceae bacterium]